MFDKDIFTSLVITGISLSSSLYNKETTIISTTYKTSGIINNKSYWWKLDPNINPIAPNDTNNPKCQAFEVEKLVQILPPATWNNWFARPKQIQDKYKLLNKTPNIINIQEIHNNNFSLWYLSTIIPARGCNKKATPLYKINIIVCPNIYFSLNTPITLNTHIRSHNKWSIDNNPIIQLLNFQLIWLWLRP